MIGSDHDFVELLWENGQILMRSSSRRAQKTTTASCSGSSPPFCKSQGDGGGYSSAPKRTRVLSETTTDSLFHRLWGLSGQTQMGNHDKVDSRLNPTQRSSPKDHYFESMADFNGTQFHEVSERKNSNSHNKNLTDSRRVPVHESPNLQTGRAYRHDSSFQRREASLPIMRSKGNSSQTSADPVGELPNLKAPKQSSSADKTREAVNFSIFLRPQALLKSNNQGSGRSRPSISPGLSRAEELRSNNRSAPGISNPVESMLIEPVPGSKSLSGLQSQPLNSATKLEPILQKIKLSEHELPDEQSEGVGDRGATYQVHHAAASLRPVNTHHQSGRSMEPPVASSSVCSRGASNDPTYTLKRRYEETDGSPYLGENVEEERQGTTKPVLSRGCKRAKRNLTTEVHNLSERRRRDKINKKMRALQELIPNCNKVDKASMLDEAIEYLKTLQLQLQMMLLGTGLCMPPMMFPVGIQQMNAARYAPYSPMGIGMDMRMHMGVGCTTTPPPPFLAPTIPATTAPPGITEVARLNMFGFPCQSIPPFLSMLGGSCTQPVLSPGAAGPAASVLLPTSAPLSGSRDSTQKINPEMTKNQTSCQATKDPKHSTSTQSND